MEVSPLLLAFLAAPWIAGALMFIAFSAAGTPKPAVDEAALLAGKYSVQIDGPFVVFIIGIYVHPRSFWRHLPVAKRAGQAMESMKRELESHPELGCVLVRHTDVGLTNPTHLVQIWRSYDDLAAYARNRMAKHLGAWLDWDAAARKFQGREVPGLGIYHEAYLVEAGQYEAVYRNCPRIGLGKIGRIVPASHGRMRSGKGRLGRSDGSDYDARAE